MYINYLLPVLVSIESVVMFAGPILTHVVCPSEGYVGDAVIPNHNLICGSTIFKSNHSTSGCVYNCKKNTLLLTS